MTICGQDLSVAERQEIERNIPNRLNEEERKVFQSQLATIVMDAIGQFQADAPIIMKRIEDETRILIGQYEQQRLERIVDRRLEEEAVQAVITQELAARPGPLDQFRSKMKIAEMVKKVIDTKLK